MSFCPHLLNGLLANPNVIGSMSLATPHQVNALKEAVPCDHTCRRYPCEFRSVEKVN